MARVGADGERPRPIERIRLGRHHDQLGAGEFLHRPQATAQLVPVDAGHHDVQQDAVRAVAGQIRERLRARRVGHDAVARLLEQPPRDVDL
jgi:hypothetical protein